MKTIGTVVAAITTTKTFEAWGLDHACPFFPFLDIVKINRNRAHENHRTQYDIDKYISIDFNGGGCRCVTVMLVVAVLLLTSSLYIYLLSREKKKKKTETNKRPDNIRFALNKTRSTVMWHIHTAHTIINHILIQFDTKVLVDFVFGIQQRFSRWNRIHKNAWAFSTILHSLAHNNCFRESYAFLILQSLAHTLASQSNRVFMICKSCCASILFLILLCLFFSMPVGCYILSDSTKKNTRFSLSTISWLEPIDFITFFSHFVSHDKAKKRHPWFVFFIPLFFSRSASLAWSEIISCQIDTCAPWNFFSFSVGYERDTGLAI